MASQQTLQLWWLSFVIFAAVIVVVAVLLGIIIAAAKRIDQHAGAIWTVGKEIAGNTVAIWMLEHTVASFRVLTESSKRIEAALDRVNAASAANSVGAQRRDTGVH